MPDRPRIWFAVLAVATVMSGAALAVSSRALAPRPLPRLVTGTELARRPIGDHIAVQCDFVQNSDHGELAGVSLCMVGQYILAVAGGDRIHDGAGLLEGYVEPIPVGHKPSWASALRTHILDYSRYYNFYLRRVSDADYEEQYARGHTAATLIRALAVAASLAALAGWFVWVRLWQHRRRAATWIVTG